MSEKLIQPSGTHSDEPRAAASRMPHYFFLGRRVCRASLAVLMGVGWSPRLSNLLKAVLRGDRAAPVDVRYMTRKHNDPTPVFSEVFSYLQNLYMSVAETLPLDEKKSKDGKEVWSEDEDAYHPETIETSNEEMKYLPPGTIYDLFRQFNATTGNRCSWHCFHSCWTKEFKHKLTFRDKYVFSICPVCVQHKLLLRGFGADSTAALRQRMLYDRHLASQFEDRKCYWSMRASSRLRSKIIVAIIDGMDQAKYAIPRSSLFQSHTFDKYTRPRLHVWGVLCHGFAAMLSVSDADASKGGSTTCELVLYLLSVLRKHSIELSEYEVVIQLDNTTSSNKNNSTAAMCGVLTQRGIVRSMRLSFLRVGHTHEVGAFKNSEDPQSSEAQWGYVDNSWG